MPEADQKYQKQLISDRSWSEVPGATGECLELLRSDRSCSGVIGAAQKHDRSCSGGTGVAQEYQELLKSDMSSTGAPGAAQE